MCSRIAPVLAAGVAATLACGDEPIPPEPATMSVNPGSLRFAALSDTSRLSAQVRDQYGEVMEGIAITWTSGDASVATVDSRGLVRSAGNGEAVVTATAGSASASADVTVEQVVSAINVSPGAVEFTALGDTARLGAEAFDANGHPVEGAAFAWASGNQSVATVDSEGFVRSAGNGDAAVTAMSGSVSDSAAVTVAQVVSAVTVSPDTLEFAALGDTLRLGAEAFDANGHAVAGAAFAWASGDSAVATVDSTGLVSAAGNGEAAVTATSRSVSDSAAVTVAQVVSAVTVSPDTLEFTALGDTLRLGAEAFDANGHAVAGAAFAWASGDSAVATVDSSGLVSAVGYGTSTVTATSGSVSANAEARVSADRIERAALRELFAATGGPNWIRRNNWLSDRPLGDWHGVLVNGGRVVGLTIDYNNLTGPLPPEIGDLEALRLLQLHGNDLTGPLPAELGNLVVLEKLELGENSLTGEIPAELGKLEALRELFLDRNNLTGPLPDLGNLSAMWRMALGSNDLTGEIPAWLGNLSALESLGMEANDFTGRIPAELGRLSNLRSLNLLLNNLTGPLPAELGRLSKLEALNLQVCGLTGPIPPEIGNLSSLVELHLESNKLTGAIPPELANLSSLKRLHLEANKLTGQLPPELGNLPNLVWFEAWGNEIDGPIPPEYGNYASLETLYLARNRLSGSIPPELGNISNLEQLFLYYNELTGPIPAELADPPRLRTVDLRRNQLTGEIPPELGRAPSLRGLDLRWNKLSGTLPPELFDSPRLGGLILGFNELSGPVPSEVGNLRSLGVLDLTDNAEMSGELPSTMIQLDTLFVLATVGTDLCAPGDPDFQKWLGGVRQARVAVCDPGEAYLTQAVQSREYPVPLVADERALLRVFVTAVKETDATIPTVVARFYSDDSEVYKVEIPAKSATIPTEVDESSLETSSNAEIPDSVIEPGTEMVIEIDPDDTLDPDLGVPKRIPAEGRLALDVIDMPTFEVTVIPFLWSEDPDSAILDVTEDMTEDDSLFWETRTLLPVDAMDVEVHEPVETSSNDIGDVLAEVRAIRAAETGTGYYQGLMFGVRGALGIAEVGGWVSASIPSESTMAHEFGHNLGLYHAPCGGAPNADPYYPHDNGEIGAWGYDFKPDTLIRPETRDLLGYCRRPRPWISEYHFSRATRHRVSKEVGESEEEENGEFEQSILLWGGVDADGVPYLEPVFVIDAAPLLPSSGGDHRLVGADADGGELFAVSFAMPETADGDGGSSFAFSLPMRRGWVGSLASVTLAGPDGTATLDRDSDIPMAILRDPRTGQVRGFMRGPQWGDPATAREAARRIGRDLEASVSRGIPDPAGWRR